MTLGLKLITHMRFHFFRLHGPRTDLPHRRHQPKAKTAAPLANSLHRAWDLRRNIDLELLAPFDKPLDCCLPRLHLGGCLEADDAVHVDALETGPCLYLDTRVLNNDCRRNLTFYFRLGCLAFRLYICTGLDLAVRLRCTGLGLGLALGVGLRLCSRLLCGRIL